MNYEEMDIDDIFTGYHEWTEEELKADQEETEKIMEEIEEYYASGISWQGV